MESGKSCLEVSVLGLGCMGMSMAYGPPADKQEMITLIGKAAHRVDPEVPIEDVAGAVTDLIREGSRNHLPRRLL